MIPTVDQVRSLPRWAQIAFAARCVRRLFNLWDRAKWLGEAWLLDRAINCVEFAAQIGRADVPRAATGDMYMADLLLKGHLGEPEQQILVATKAAISAAGTAEQPAYEGYGPSLVRLAAETVVSLEPRLSHYVWRDFETLFAEARRCGWTDRTAVPPYAFSLHAHFFVGAGAVSQGHLAVESRLDDRLRRMFAENPNYLHNLSPSEFEVFVGELTQRAGFRVELTQRTRDGGYDILAIDDRTGRAKYLIEAKLYAPTRTVGVGVVRELGGALIDFGGAEGMAAATPRGVLVTTARFSGPAIKYLDRNDWLLEGADFGRLMAWLDDRDRLEMMDTIRSLPIGYPRHTTE